MKVSYSRSIALQSCHFNNLDVYRNYDKLLNILESQKNIDRQQIKSLLLSILKGTHGHNFTVIVFASCLVDRSLRGGFVIDDIALENVVHEWNNTNLSVNSDFDGIRATTENMALVLYRKLRKRFSKLDFKVEIHETIDASAHVQDSGDDPRCGKVKS